MKVASKFCLFVLELYKNDIHNASQTFLGLQKENACKFGKHPLGAKRMFSIILEIWKLFLKFSNFFQIVLGLCESAQNFEKHPLSAKRMFPNILDT